MTHWEQMMTGTVIKIDIPQPTAIMNYHHETHDVYRLSLDVKPATLTFMAFNHETGLVYTYQVENGARDGLLIEYTVPKDGHSQETWMGRISINDYVDMHLTDDARDVLRDVFLLQHKK